MSAHDYRSGLCDECNWPIKSTFLHTPMIRSCTNPRCSDYDSRKLGEIEIAENTRIEKYKSPWPDV